MSEELQYQVILDEDLQPKVGGVVAFGDFELVEGDELGVVFQEDEIRKFYEDLVMGRPFPMALAMRRLDSVGKVLAVVLFLHRALVLNPRTLHLVSAADMVERYQMGGASAADENLVGLFRLIGNYLPPKVRGKEQQRRLTTVVGWVKEYIETGTLPALPAVHPPQILETGTGGFVVAETARSVDSLEDAWVWLFRQGYLWGMVCSPAKDGRRKVLGGRKSVWCPLVPSVAAERLNTAEKALDDVPGWHGEWNRLTGPPGGTQLPIEALVKVLIHV